MISKVFPSEFEAIVTLTVTCGETGIEPGFPSLGIIVFEIDPFGRYGISPKK